MCGRLNVIDDGLVAAMLAMQGVSNPGAQRYGRFFSAASQVFILLEDEDGRRLQNVTWWSLLKHASHGMVLSDYTSFNSRYDKLNLPGSAGYQACRQ